MQRLFNILRIQCGSNASIAFPLKAEGKGKIILGNNVTTKRGVLLSCSEKCILKLGNKNRLGEAVRIYVTNGAQLQTGNGSTIGDFTTCMAHAGWQIGDNVSIATHCQVFSREKGCAGKLLAGDGTNIGDFTIIDVSADVTIGNTVAIGPRCIIYTHDHDYKEQGTAAPWKGKPVTKPVTIQNGAWIGSNVTILPGVTIGEKAIIAAGSVVTKDIPANSLYGGIPAKQIRASLV